jgi:putative flippase GtrA
VRVGHRFAARVERGQVAGAGRVEIAHGSQSRPGRFGDGGGTFLPNQTAANDGQLELRYPGKVHSVAEMIKAKLTDRTTQVRLLRFLTVGGTTAAVQFLLLWLLTPVWVPTVAFTCAFLGATSVHYFLNRFWALPSYRQDTGRQLGEYLLTVALSYAINVCFFEIGESLLGLSVMWAAVGAAIPAMVAVFLILNYRVFRSAKVNQ